MRRIEQCVQSVQARRQREWLWECASSGLLASGCLAFVVVILRRLFAGEFGWSWILAILAAGPAAGAVYAMLRPISARAAAVTIDRCCGFKDRIATAIGFLNHSSGSGDAAFQRLQIEDAENQVAAVDPTRVVLIRQPRLWPAAIGISMAALLLAFVTMPRQIMLAAEVANDVVTAQADRADEGLEELRQLQKEENNPELEKLLKELEKNLDMLRQPETDPREALAQLSEMEAALQTMHQQLQDPQIDAQLQEIGNALALSEAMAAAGQALSKGELDKAAEELIKLEAPELDRKTEKAVTEKLDQIAKNAGVGQQKQQLKEAIAKMSEGLTSGQRGKFKDGAQGLAGECSKQSRRKKLSDLLRKQCQCLSECKGECESECRSQSNSSKKGGNKAGSASSGNEPGDKTAKLKTNPEMNLKGQESGQGDVDIETSTAPEQEQDAVRSYRQNVDKYEALSESVLESESIPLGHRRTIRRYFEMIRPQGNETDAVNSATSEESGSASSNPNTPSEN